MREVNWKTSGVARPQIRGPGVAGYLFVSGAGVGVPPVPRPNVSSGDSGLNRGYATTWGETAGTKVGTHGQYPAGLGKAVIRKYYVNEASMMRWRVTRLHFARGAASIKVVCGQRCIKLWSGRAWGHSSGAWGSPSGIATSQCWTTWGSGEGALKSLRCC